MMRVIVNLLPAEFEQLRQMAQEERRPVRDQAGYLLSRSLKSAAQPTNDAASDRRAPIPA